MRESRFYHDDEGTTSLAAASSRRWTSPTICSSSSSSSSSSLSPWRRQLLFRSGSGASSESETCPFDRTVKGIQRTRSAKLSSCYYERYLQRAQQTKHQDDDDTPHCQRRPTLPYDYFHIEVAKRLVDRLDDINISSSPSAIDGNGGFPLALELGTRGNIIYNALVDIDMDEDDDFGLSQEDHHNNNNNDNNMIMRTGRGGVQKLVRIDSCSTMLHRDDDEDHDDTGLCVSSYYVKQNKNNVTCETFELVHDIDSQSTTGLPFPSNTFDIVISSMSLHWVNDLPQLLSEVERILRPDGCFLFALPGGNTLPELRSSLVLAELERTGGVSTHVGPYVDLSNVGSLLTGVGFKLPTIDIDDVHIGYPNSMTLMEHLGRMGEGNACTSRKERVGLGTFLGAACLYDELYPTEDDNDDGGGGIVASVQVIYGIAWKEHESQQKPDVRGSATKKIGDVSITKTPGGDV